MNQRVGYARVSTDDQNLDLQRDPLRLAGVSSICEEAASGKTAVRQELDQCLKSLRAGDTLVVQRLDGLGRSLTDLLQIVAGLEDKGIGFESIAEKIETGSATGKLPLTMAPPPGPPITSKSAGADLHVELRRGAITMSIICPRSATAEFAYWTRDVLG